MVLLAITADTWIVTGLGFGIVLLLLIVLVFILNLFGWIMQTAEEGPKIPRALKTPKAQKSQSTQSAQSTLNTPDAPSDQEKAAIAMSIAKAGDEDIAAIAYALYLAQNKTHDIPTAMISLHKHETAWNEKSIGMNNVGF